MKDNLRNIIKEEIKILFETFEFDNNKEFVPPQDVSAVATLALSVHNLVKQRGWKIENSNSGDGNGTLKAKYLSEKNPQSFSDMKRLKAYFTGNEQVVNDDRKKYGVSESEKGTKKEMTRSQNLLMWNLYGGDVCKNWVDKEIETGHEENLKSKAIARDAGGAGINKGMGSMGAPKDPTKRRIHR